MLLSVVGSAWKPIPFLWKSRRSLSVLAGLLCGRATTTMRSIAWLTVHCTRPKAIKRTSTVWPCETECRYDGEKRTGSRPGAVCFQAAKILHSSVMDFCSLLFCRRRTEDKKIWPWYGWIYGNVYSDAFKNVSPAERPAKNFYFVCNKTKPFRIIMAAKQITKNEKEKQQ